MPRQSDACTWGRTKERITDILESGGLSARDASEATAILRRTSFHPTSVDQEALEAILRHHRWSISRARSSFCARVAMIGVGFGVALWLFAHGYQQSNWCSAERDQAMEKLKTVGVCIALVTLYFGFLGQMSFHF